MPHGESRLPLKMGRVVKGARVAPQAYYIRPPSLAPASPGAVQFERAVPEEPLETPQAPVDFDAVRAEAAKLIDDASANAEALLHEARERALEVVQDAQRRAETIETEARQHGFEQGTGDGRAAAQAEMDEMLATMRGLVEMARAERHKIVESAEPEIVRLAVNIAERILNQHVAVDPNAVLEMTRSAIVRLVNRETVTVRVNPADIETMRENRERLMAMNDVDNMRLVEDQRVDRGGVVIETEAGTIDAKVSTQLREVRRLLAVDDPRTVAPSSGPAILNAPAQAS